MLASPSSMRATSARWWPATRAASAGCTLHNTFCTTHHPEAGSSSPVVSASRACAITCAHGPVRKASASGGALPLQDLLPDAAGEQVACFGAHERPHGAFAVAPSARLRLVPGVLQSRQRDVESLGSGAARIEQRLGRLLQAFHEGRKAFVLRGRPRQAALRDLFEQAA